MAQTNAGRLAGRTMQAMIGYLEGTAKAPDLVLCGGVGYKVATPDPLTDGATVALHVVTIVRETALDLYGFTSAPETDLFRTLLKVTGVGPTAALDLLSQLGAAPLAAALARGDHAALTRCKGVGTKKAQTLCNSVTIPESLLAALGADHTEPDAVTAEADDVVEALMGLGFTDRESRTAAAAARGAHPGTDDVQVLLRSALAAAR